MDSLFSQVFSLENSAEWAGGVAQVVESLSRKCKALSSNPSNTKKEGGIVTFSCLFYIIAVFKSGKWKTTQNKQYDPF
jgi:hypothetical protein